MLIHNSGNWVTLSSSLQQQQQKQPFLLSFVRPSVALIPGRGRPSSYFSSSQALSSRILRITLCNARRRVRYEEDEEDEEYGVNEDILMLELYSQSAREEALLVKAQVDGQEVELLIFKGFSSSLSYGTSPDPAKSILPARAVIKSVDRVKGPFDPSNIEYIQKGLTWEAFKSSFLSNS